MPSKKISVPGARMVSSVRRESVETNPGKCRFVNNASARLIRKDRYIATPPKRGSGVGCMCRPCGDDTQPRAMAKPRTLLVRTNENNNDNPKVPKYKTVNQALHGQTPEARTLTSFQSKRSALADSVGKHYSEMKWC